MTKHRQYIARNRTLALSLVALYGLAFVRSLFPGMCATQVAVETGDVSIGSGTCCAHASLSAPDQPENDAPSRAQAPRCAFCLLALAPCTTSPYADNGVSSQSFKPLLACEPAPYRSHFVPDTNVGRDPPTNTLS